MNLKVIKPIKGLVEGDILYYNQDKDQYEITKIDEEISDKGIDKKAVKVIISDYLVDDYKEFFTYIDEENNEVTVKELQYVQKEVISRVDENSGIIESLKKENEELKSQLENSGSLKIQVDKEDAWLNYYEWKALREWYKQREWLVSPMLYT